MVKLYQVGGSVRDHFLGVKSNDIDYAVDAGCKTAAEGFAEMREYILEEDYKIFLEKPEFLTIRAFDSKSKKQLTSPYVAQKVPTLIIVIPT